MESNSRPKPPEVLLSSAALRECSLSNLQKLRHKNTRDRYECTERRYCPAIWSAAQSVGFFTVINHGIPQYDIEKCFNVSYAAIQKRNTPIQCRA